LGPIHKDIVFLKMMRLLKILKMFRLSKKRSSLISETPSYMRMVQLLASFVCGLHYMSCIYWATAVHIGFDDDPEHVWVPDTSFHEAPFGEKCTLHFARLHDYLSTQLLYNIDHLCALHSPFALCTDFYAMHYSLLAFVGSDTQPSRFEEYIFQVRGLQA
jgi:hypothetical protein